MVEVTGFVISEGFVFFCLFLFLLSLFSFILYFLKLIFLKPFFFRIKQQQPHTTSAAQWISHAELSSPQSVMKVFRILCPQVLGHRTSLFIFWKLPGNCAVCLVCCLCVSRCSMSAFIGQEDGWLSGGYIEIIVEGGEGCCIKTEWDK